LVLVVLAAYLSHEHVVQAEQTCPCIGDYGLNAVKGIFKCKQPKKVTGAM